ncbi:MAG: DUF1800 domain-containing protein [Xanthomonadales bacterium]|nr:DUF1800 domain-containing protein [Xanthomonadales bacterium]
MNAIPLPAHPAAAAAAGGEIEALLERTGYGFTRAERAQAHELGYEGWVDHQLALPASADADLEAELARSLPLLFASPSDLGAIASGEVRLRTQALNEFLAGVVLRAWFSKRQLFQRMVEFVGELVYVAASDARLGTLKILDDREVIRAHAFGRFRELLGASARSPAMLVYLDNAQNGRDGINENYARELLELHTLGVDGGYDERDVVEVARCFSGWTYDRNTLRFQFRASWHDRGAKQVLGRSIPAGGGIEDGEIVLDLLAAHPSTARHVCTRLARRFVADRPPAELVEDVAAVFAGTGGDLKATLRALLLHPITRATPPSKLKRPFELVVGALRALEAQVREGLTRGLVDQLAALGHRPYAWPAPNGFPDVAGYWNTPRGLLARWNTLHELLLGELSGRLSISWSGLLGGANRAAPVADALLEVFPAALGASGGREGWHRLAAELGGSGTLVGAKRDELARKLALAMLASPPLQLR